MKTEQPESNCWIIITPISGTKDAVVGYWEVGGGGKQTPMTYATQREAWKQIVEDQIWRFEEFIEDDRLPDGKVPEFLPKNTVCPCTLNPDGSITTESYGLLFDGIPRESDFSITMAKDLKWRAPLWNTDEVSIGYQEFSRDFVESVLDVDPDYLYATEGTDLLSFLGQGETEDDYIKKARARYGLAEDFEGAGLALFVLLRKIYEMKTGAFASPGNNASA